MSNKTKETILLSGNDRIGIGRKDIQIHFAGRRQVLGTSVLNGGYSEGLTSVFNYDEKADLDNVCSMEEATYEEHLRNVAEVRLGLNPNLVSGLSTACNMSSYSFRQEQFLLKDGFLLVVSALVTGGIDKNGARVGDHSDWAELGGKYYQISKDVVAHDDGSNMAAHDGGSNVAAHDDGSNVAAHDDGSNVAAHEDGSNVAAHDGGSNVAADKEEANEEAALHAENSGTINIFLHVNARMTQGCMARALVTATEAKVAAVSELLCPSLYSDGLATGSGTDGTIIIGDAESDELLTHAGKDCKFGEMIGRVVKRAVKEAIGKQTNVTPKTQHSVLKRLERFGVTEDLMDKSVPDESETLVVEASILAHLLDQLEWGMLSAEEIMAYYGMEGKPDPAENPKQYILRQWLEQKVHDERAELFVNENFE